MADPFKAYDVRGQFPEQLDEDLAHHIGNAAAQVLDLAGKRFAVGRDMRLSSPYLKQGLIRGLVEAGVRVVDVGMTSSPGLTFAIHHLATDGGIQVTASHNPAPYGGFKITGPGHVPVGTGTGLDEIEELARTEKVAEAAGGGVEDALFLDAYARFLAGRWHVARPLRVVVDAGNGIAGHVLEHLLPHLDGLEVIPMYFDPDGRFPNHDANPLKEENLADLRARVLAEKADFGVAFDGDGDRCALVDETGRPVPCDLATALLARRFLAAEPGGTVVYDLRSSQAVPELVRELGGEPVETRVGHSFIKATMKEHGACFAGELSGHYYFRDFFGADSGLLALIFFCEVISEAGSLSALVQPLRRYHHSGEINYQVDDKEAVFQRLRDVDGAEVEELDGVTLRFSDWWCNVRASNTEPVIRLNLEAATETDMRDRIAWIEGIISPDRTKTVNR